MNVLEKEEEEEELSPHSSAPALQQLYIYRYQLPDTCETSGVLTLIFC